MKRIFAVMLAIALLTGFAALADEGELKVSGSGTVYMQADRASACLGVTLTGEDLGALQQQANATVAAIVEALVEAGLEEKNISTNYIYINPRYDYSGETQEMIGYSINNVLTIRTENIDSIGSYIDAAFAAGANSFDSIDFSVADDRAARLQALELAVQNAQQKAETIAAAAGKSLGKIDEIIESSNEYSYYNSTSGGARYAIEETAMLDAGTTVRAAQVSVTASVQIAYELRD